MTPPCNRPPSNAATMLPPPITARSYAIAPDASGACSPGGMELPTSPISRPDNHHEGHEVGETESAPRKIGRTSWGRGAAGTGGPCAAARRGRALVAGRGHGRGGGVVRGVGGAQCAVGLVVVGGDVGRLAAEVDRVLV